MNKDIIIAIAVVTCIIGVTIICCCKPSSFSGENEALISHRPSSSDISYSNPRNNHDHLKHKHTTRASAEREVRRMQNAGYEGSHRLKAYYNEQLDGYFVGKGWDF